MAEKLTERQRDILSYIKWTLDVVGVAPSTQEIQQEFSFKSPNAVQTHLLALQRMASSTGRTGRRALSVW